MKLTDWLGNEYGPGDTVIYPVGASRSIELQMAEVVDIWTVYQCPEDYKWKRLDEGADVPTKEEFDWDRSGEQPVRVSKGHKPVDTELRVRLQPLGKGSRGFHTRTDEVSYWVDPEGNDIEWDAMNDRILKDHGYDHNDRDLPWYKRQHPTEFGYSVRREAVKPKPVILTLGINNITLIKKAEGAACPDCGSTDPIMHTFHLNK